MSGFSCDYCGKGTVRDQVFKDYETKRGPVRWVVPRAMIGVCDRCGGRYYHAKEVKRWDKFRPK